MCTAVHSLCSDLSKDFPLRISFSHVAGVKNISDFNSKLVPNQDPIVLINSPAWRYGNPEFTDSDFPGQQNIFMQFKGGNMSFYKQPVIVKCCCLGQLCITSPTPYQFQGCIPAGDVIPAADATPTHVKNVFRSESAETGLTDLLFYLPIIPEVQYVRLMKRYHLHKLVRLLSRVLPKILNQEVLAKIGHKVTNIEDNRKAVSESVKAGYELLPSENQSLMHKLAFLTIIRSSNKVHRPKKGGIVNGISILETRYTTSAMQKVYGSTIVPIVSSNDKLFLKRHFFHAPEVTAI